MGDDMPILGATDMLPIPWSVIAPHERQAYSNHSQSLRELARRGGLSPCEAVAILEDRRYRRMRADLAIERLAELIAAAAP